MEGTPMSVQERRETAFTEQWDFITVSPEKDFGTSIAETPLDELAAYKAAVILPKVVLPVLLVVGVAGNLLTLATLHSRAYGPSPSTVGLTLLAVADTGHLIGNLRWWANAMFHVDFRMVSPAACRFHKMWTYYFRHLSSCTLAFITLERVVCVCFPIQWKTTFTAKKNILFTGAMALVLFGINLQIPFKYSLEFWPDSNKTECNMYVTEKTWYESVWIPLDQTLHTFLPSTIILVGNMIIICTLRCQSQITGDTAERHKSITVMLVAVSVMYLLTTLPSAIFYLGDARGAWPDNTNYLLAEVILAHTFTMLWARVNYAINFLLYCVTGSKFRNAFLTTFVRRKRHQKPSQRPSSNVPVRTVSQLTAETEIM